jgi:hypothetical protein
VLYIDFLGVSAASTWDEDRASGIIKILKEIASMRSSFDINGESLADGSYKFKVSAETSTFSDHIVASYPVLPDWPLPIELLLEIYLKLSQDIVRQTAVAALNIGLLIRGCLTMGKLYHGGADAFAHFNRFANGLASS